MPAALPRVFVAFRLAAGIALIVAVTVEIAASRGSVQRIPPDLRVGYLAQGLPTPDAVPLRDVLFPRAADLRAAEAEVERLAAALAGAGSDLSALATAYDAALARLEHLSRDYDPGTVERVLSGLELAALPLDAPVGTLSGGQKTRLGLAALLLDDPQLLILDEPTNHLDVTALAWLEGWLRDFPGGALIVSHDRTFLDETVTRLVALDDRQSPGFDLGAQAAGEPVAERIRCFRHRSLDLRISHDERIPSLLRVVVQGMFAMAVALCFRGSRRNGLVTRNWVNHVSG